MTTYIPLQLEWILDKAQDSIGKFSQLIFTNPASSLSDTKLGHVIDNMALVLKKSYKSHIFGSKQPSFSSSHKDRHARTLIVAEEEALTASLINSSNTRTGNSLIITSSRKCDVVQNGIFQFHLRLDSLCFAICSSTGDMKRLIELYKVMMRNSGLSQTCKKHG